MRYYTTIAISYNAYLHDNIIMSIVDAAQTSVTLSPCISRFADLYLCPPAATRESRRERFAPQ